MNVALNLRIPYAIELIMAPLVAEILRLNSNNIHSYILLVYSTGFWELILYYTLYSQNVYRIISSVTKTERRAMESWILGYIIDEACSDEKLQI